MCSLAFFAFLRVGEITATWASASPFQIHQLTKLLNPAKEVIGLKITFQDFKHNYNPAHFILQSIVRMTIGQFSHYLITLRCEAMIKALFSSQF